MIEPGLVGEVEGGEAYEEGRPTVVPTAAVAPTTDPTTTSEHSLRTQPMLLSCLPPDAVYGNQLQVRQYFTDASFYAFDISTRGICGAVYFPCRSFAPSAATVKVKYALTRSRWPRNPCGCILQALRSIAYKGRDLCVGGYLGPWCSAKQRSTQTMYDLPLARFAEMSCDDHYTKTIVNEACSSCEEMLRDSSQQDISTPTTMPYSTFRHAICSVQLSI